jgi:hypothetical protein
MTDILRPGSFDFIDYGGGEDFRLFIGAVWAWQLNFSRADGIPIDMTGDTFVMHARVSAADNQALFALSAAELTPQGPLLTCVMPAASTIAVRRGELVYGITRNITSTGEQRPFLAGKIHAEYFPQR